MQSQKAKKEQKELNYWYAAEVFAANTIKYCIKFPPSYKYGLTDHLIDISRKIYELAIVANNVFINVNGKPEELIEQYETRDRYLREIMDLTGKFDANFNLLMREISIEYDTRQFMLRAFADISIDLYNAGYKGHNIDVKYGIAEGLYYTIPDGEGKEKIIRLKFSSHNKSAWLWSENVLKDAVKLRLSKDKRSITGLKKHTENAAPSTAEERDINAAG